jgi:hypothetical protein
LEEAVWLTVYIVEKQQGSKTSIPLHNPIIISSPSMRPIPISSDSIHCQMWWNVRPGQVVRPAGAGLRGGGRAQVDRQRLSAGGLVGYNMYTATRRALINWTSAYGWWLG